MDESPVVEVIVRPFHPAQDQGMIYSTWRNSSYYSAVIKPEKENDRYFKELTKEISQILKTALVKIACISDCPIVIIGYSVSRGDHLDYIYVKPDWRNKGIGTLLYPKEIQTVSSAVTKIGLEICQKKKLVIKGDLKS